MRSYAARHRGDERTLLLMAPGWVKTDLGGPGASLTIDESIPALEGGLAGPVDLEATPLVVGDAALAGGHAQGAGATGLEPATSGVTGRRSNQLSYAPER
jgi:hypothetical protein